MSHSAGRSRIFCALDSVDLRSTALGPFSWPRQNGATTKTTANRRPTKAVPTAIPAHLSIVSEFSPDDESIGAQFVGAWRGDRFKTSVCEQAVAASPPRN